MTNKTSDNSNLTRVNTATVIAVLALHIGIAAALTHMHMPKKVVEKPEEVKPVEIQLLSLQEAAEPAPIEVEQPTSEQSMPTAENQETSADQPQNQPKPEKNEPQAKSKPQVEPERVEETEAVNESEPELELEQQTEPETDLEADPKLETELDTDLEIVTKVKITPIIDTNEHHRLIEQKDPEQKGPEQKGPEQKGPEQKGPEQKGPEQKGPEQKGPEQKGPEQKGPEQKGPKQEPANDTPKSFSESQARWKHKPNFKLPMKEDRRVSLGETFSVTLELIVDKQGNVTKATVIKSSGNKVVDDATVKAVKKSKLHPFTENNLPVVGTVTLPVDYVKK